MNKVSKNDNKIKLAIGYLIREEKNLLTTFKDYNLQMTKFNMEYRTVAQTKWKNYGMYTNFESGKFKFISKIKKNK